MMVFLSRLMTSKEPLPLRDLQQTLWFSVVANTVWFHACHPSKLRTKQLAVGRPLYIGDKDIIIINSKSNIKYQGNYILL